MNWCIHSLYTTILNKNIQKKYNVYNVYIPGTQMTLVLIGKDLVLKGSTTKIEDKQVPGIYVNLYTSQFFGSKIGAAPTHPWTRKLSFRTPTCLPPRSFKRMPSGRFAQPVMVETATGPKFLPSKVHQFLEEWRMTIMEGLYIHADSYWRKLVLGLKISRSCIFYWRRALYLRGSHLHTDLRWSGLSGRCRQQPGFRHRSSDDTWPLDAGVSKGLISTNSIFCWDTV